MNLFYLATIFYSMFPKEDLHHCKWDVAILYHEKNIGILWASEVDLIYILGYEAIIKFSVIFPYFSLILTFYCLASLHLNEISLMERKPCLLVFHFLSCGAPFWAMDPLVDPCLALCCFKSGFLSNCEGRSTIP